MGYRLQSYSGKKIAVGKLAKVMQVVLPIVLCLCLVSCKSDKQEYDGEQITQAPTSVTTPAQTTPEQTTPAQTTPEQTTPEQTTPEQTTPEQTTPEQTTPALPDPDFSNLPDSEGTKRY